MTVEYRDVPTRQIAILETLGKQWMTTDRGIKEYGAQFKPVLGGRALIDLLRERTLPVQGVADVMGFGDFLFDFKDENLPFSWGASFSLEHEEPVQFRSSTFKKERIARFIGDVTLDELWGRYKQFQRKHQLPDCDFVICAPLGGYYEDCFPMEVSVFNELLQHMWNDLLGDHGTVLTEVPRWIPYQHDIIWETWVKKVQQFCCIDQKNYDVVMKLEKTPDTQSLPNLE